MSSDECLRSRGAVEPDHLLFLLAIERKEIVPHSDEAQPAITLLHYVYLKITIGHDRSYAPAQ